MNLADARAMVAQLFSRASDVQREVIAQHMAKTGVNAIHAAWQLYGRHRGLTCYCTPCLMEPLPPELKLRILAGREPANDIDHDAEVYPC